MSALLRSPGRHPAWLALLAVVVAATTVAATTVAAPPTSRPAAASIGTAAPDFSLVDANGQERSLSSFKGRIVVLEWTNPECPIVQRLHKGAMQETQRQVKAMDKGLVWLGINSTAGTNAEANQYWLRRHRLTHPLLLDATGVVARLYDARRTPHMIVIDKAGTLRYRGAIDDNRLGVKPKGQEKNYIVNAVRQILAGEPVAPDRVKAYGCRIKRRD